MDTIVAVLIIALAAFYIAKKYRRDWKRSDSCSCGKMCNSTISNCSEPWCGTEIDGKTE